MRKSRTDLLRRWKMYYGDKDPKDPKDNYDDEDLDENVQSAVWAFFSTLALFVIFGGLFALLFVQ